MTTRGRRAAIAAAAVAAAILIGALAGLLAASGDDDAGGGQADNQPRRTDSEPGAGAPVGDDGNSPGAARANGGPKGAALEPLATGKPGSGTARLIGRGPDARLELRVSGLPPLEEQYAVWLYNSVSDARRVATVFGGSFTVRKRLPAGAAGYELIDISREPLDDNPNHSGESVLRVPVKSLPRAAK